MMLSLLICFPLLMLFILVCTPSHRFRLHRLLAMVAALVQLGISLYVYQSYKVDDKLWQFEERLGWFELDLGAWGKMLAHYHVAVDGASVLLVLLSAVVFLFSVVASWQHTKRSKGYYALLLMLMCSVPACFVVRDYLLFYVFFEFMLLPMYFLIGLWGGEKREYAALKFFIYTLVGSLLILMVFIGGLISTFDPMATANELGITVTSKDSPLPDSELIAIQKALSDNPTALVRSFDMALLANPQAYLPGSYLSLGHTMRWWAFWAILIGFLIKLPSVPLHTWLPDAHVEAPTAISVVLAGVLLKIGGYGILRFVMPMFAELWQQYAGVVALLAVLSIVYGALNALAMSDLKKLIAYSSVSHMGYVLLGFASLTEEGFQGATFQMMSHGVLSAGLFLASGVLYERTGDRQISHYSGLWHKMPRFSALSFLLMFAALGLPAFSAFIGEVFTLIGVIRSDVLHIGWALGGALGIVLSAAYFLWTLQRMYMGELWVVKPDYLPALQDLKSRELFLLACCVALSLLWGVYPKMLFSVSEQAILWLLNSMP